MKKLITLSMILVSACSITTAQSLIVKVNGSIHALGEFETSFIAAGAGVEGALSYNFSVGMDAGYGTDNNFKFIHFTPTFKFYPFESLRGIYIGVGATFYSVMSKDKLPIGYPLDELVGAKALVGGPEAFLGLQTIIDDEVSLGFQVGLGVFPDIEAPFINANFTVGISL